MVLNLFLTVISVFLNQQQLKETQKKDRVAIFYVNFLSECCGINNDALITLQKLEFNYIECFIKTKRYWGKEGEMIFFYTCKENFQTEFERFSKEAITTFSQQYNLVTAEELLVWNTQENKITIKEAPNFLNKTNEDECLLYLKKEEIENKIKLMDTIAIRDNDNLEIRRHQITIILDSLKEENQKALLFKIIEIVNRK